MPDKINIGLAGLGSIAKNAHIPALSSFKDINLISAAEADSDYGKKITSKWKIPNFYSDYTEMIDEGNLDGIFICLPNFLHYEAAQYALKQNVNVFCEKPMGLSPKYGRELVEIAKKRDLTLAVGYNHRLEENNEKAANFVKNLRLGSILQINGIIVNAGPYAGWIPHSDWFFKDKYGVLYDSGPHLIDLIMYILSDDITEISAKGINTMHSLNVYDNIACTFKTKKGILGTLNIGWKVASNYKSVQIHGTGASLFINPSELEFRYKTYGPLERISDHVKFTNEIISTNIKNLINSTATANTFYKEDRKFIDAISTGSKPKATGEDGIRVLEVLEAIKKSIEHEKNINVNL